MATNNSIRVSKSPTSYHEELQSSRQVESPKVNEFIYMYVVWYWLCIIAFLSLLY